MSRIFKQRPRAPLVIDADPVPERRAEPVERVPHRRGEGLFTSFHYSYQEVSLVGGRAKVRSHSASLENGRLTTESFEGDAGQDEYDRVLAEAQRQFLAQTRAMLDSFAVFVPLMRRPTGRD